MEPSTAVIVFFKCILATGGVVYQDVPCSDAPYWATQNETIIEQLEVQVPMPTQEQVQQAKEIAEREIEWYKKRLEEEQKEKEHQQILDEIAARREQERNLQSVRCAQWDAQIRGEEEIALKYWGDIAVTARTQAARRQYQLECQ
jgi:hypothetical protein